MPNQGQRRAPANSRLAEALARALINQRGERQGMSNATSKMPVTQFAGDAHIEPPYRYRDRMPFDPRHLDQIPAPLTPPSPNPPLLPPAPLPDGGPPSDEGEFDQRYHWEKPTPPQWVNLNKGALLPAPIPEFQQAGQLGSLLVEALLRKAQ
jgi:hypothetical protein